MSNTIDFGIDLGTTNSVIARHSGGTVEVLRNPMSLKETLPSVVAYRKNRILVGDKAREFMERDHGNVVGGFKRKMGTADRFHIQSLDQAVSPIELSAQVLRELKGFVQNAAAPEAAVITIPASFDTMQSNATREAGLLAGFSEVALLQEPIAASLAYANRQEKFGRPIEKGQWLVYDLGGGTFDVALVRLMEGEMRVIDHEGDNFLGGADFDDLIVMKLILPELEKQGKFEDLERQMKSASGKYNGLYYKLLLLAEDAKIQLSSMSNAEIEFEVEDDDGEEQDCYFILERAAFEGLITTYIEQTVTMMQRILLRNGLEASALDFVLMVGGSTYIPHVRKLVGEGMGLPVNCDIDPATAVGEGAAYYAGTKQRKAKQGGISLEKEKKPKTERAAALNIRMAYSKTSKDNSEYFTAKIEGGEMRNLFYRIQRTDGGFDSGLKILEPRIEEDLPLVPETFNTFRMVLIDDVGNLVRDDLPEIGIAHGKYAVTGQPLPQDICIEVDDLETKRTKLEPIFRKNQILPLRKTITKQVVKTIIKGSEEKIVITLFEGPHQLMPSVNLPIGFIVVKGDELERDLIKGSDVEITVAISESRDISISACLLMTDQEFSEVFSATERYVNLDRLLQDLSLLKQRALENERSALEKDDLSMASKLAKIKLEIEEIEQHILGMAPDDITDARYQLDDRKRRIARQLSEMTLEQEVEDAKLDYFEAKRYCNFYLDKVGTEAERINFAEIQKQEREILQQNNLARIQDLEKRMRELSYNVRWRSFDFLAYLFASHYAPRMEEFLDQAAAAKWVDMGNLALSSNDVHGLQVVINRLYELLPAQSKPSFDLGTGIA